MSTSEQENEQQKQQRLQQRLRQDIEQMRERCQTISMATIDANQQPNVSYAPFIFERGCYYVLISHIAKHAQNLMVHPQLSLMLIEDEQDARHIYARKRLTYSANAVVISREDALYTSLLAKLAAKFGEIIDNLSELDDMHLFQLTPDQGLLVKGFGQAYRVLGEDNVQVVHLDQGHQRRGHVHTPKEPAQP